jgi:hypothetical protein
MRTASVLAKMANMLVTFGTRLARVTVFFRSWKQENVVCDALIHIL